MGRKPQSTDDGGDSAQKNNRGKSFNMPEKSIIVLEENLDNILSIIQIPEHKEAVSMQKRFLKYRNSIFKFLYHHLVPPDKIASERAIRNVKVKQKISGQFKSGRGADGFCVIRSVVDTLIKQSKNVMETF